MLRIVRPSYWGTSIQCALLRWRRTHTAYPDEWSDNRVGPALVCYYEAPGKSQAMVLGSLINHFIQSCSIIQQ